MSEHSTMAAVNRYGTLESSPSRSRSRKGWRVVATIALVALAIWYVLRWSNESSQPVLGKQEARPSL